MHSRGHEFESPMNRDGRISTFLVAVCSRESPPVIKIYSKHNYNKCHSCLKIVLLGGKGIAA